MIFFFRHITGWANLSPSSCGWYLL